MTKKTDATTENKEIETQEVSVLKGLQAELEKMRAELKDLKATKRELSDAEKKAVEEARDEMLTDDDVGALYIDDRFKEEGYHYTIVDTTRPGRVALRIKQGYEIVENPDLKVGSNTVSNASTLTSAVTVELGKNHACLGVLMRIPTEKYNKRQQAKVKRNRETDTAMMQSMVNKSDFGSIEIGSDVYKK
jgi:hypothetical protein